MICKKCGAENAPENELCSVCGADLRAEPQEAGTEEIMEETAQDIGEEEPVQAEEAVPISDIADDEPAVTAQPQKKTKVAAIISIVLIAVLILASAGTLAYYYLLKTDYFLDGRWVVADNPGQPVIFEFNKNKAKQIYGDQTLEYDLEYKSKNEIVLSFEDTDPNTNQKVYSYFGMKPVIAGDNLELKILYENKKYEKPVDGIKLVKEGKEPQTTTAAPTTTSGTGASTSGGTETTAAAGTSTEAQSKASTEATTAAE